MCMCLPLCVLIPGRTSSECELLGSSVGVPGGDTGKSRGREKEDKKELRKERATGEREGSRVVALLNPTSETHMQRKTTHRERLR